LFRISRLRLGRATPWRAIFISDLQERTRPFNPCHPHCYREKSRMLPKIFSGLLCTSLVSGGLSLMEIRPTLFCHGLSSWPSAHPRYPRHLSAVAPGSPKLLCGGGSAEADPRFNSPFSVIQEQFQVRPPIRLALHENACRGAHRLRAIRFGQTERSGGARLQ
jgi:hypothetical protein